MVREELQPSYVCVCLCDALCHECQRGNTLVSDVKVMNHVLLVAHTMQHFDAFTMAVTQRLGRKAV